MNQKRLLLARRACVLLALGCWAEASRGGDEEEPSLPVNISPDQPVDRMSQVEARLRDLEQRNQRLQKRYDDLSRKDTTIQQRFKSPVLGAEAGNTDGKGIPGGLGQDLPELGRSGEETDAEAAGSEEEQQEPEEGDTRRQSGAGGAGVRVGRTGQPLRYPFPGPARYPFRTGPGSSGRGSERRQSGTSGPGVRVAVTSGAAMGEYVEQRGSYVHDMRPMGIPAAVQFREGLQIRTSDEFFTMEFHNLTQLDFRVFSQTGDALHDNFVIPRQRWYFQGDVTPFATYYTVINRGYGTLDILDSWVDFSFAPKYKGQLQLRVGRMKTPYTYEYIKISESDLIAPERSLFVTNFAPNREIGAMLHGQIFDRILEYFVGVFNGPRRSFQDFNNSKDIFSFFNYRPFLNSNVEWLKYLNIGGSINGGDERNPVQPIALTTANDQSTAGSPAIVNVSPTFLIFNSKAFENGPRMPWSGDLAYYIQELHHAGGLPGRLPELLAPGVGGLAFRHGLRCVCFGGLCGGR
jgi:hypothetical protein